MTTVGSDSKTGVDPTPKDVKKFSPLPRIEDASPVYTGHYKPILKNNTSSVCPFPKVQGCCNNTHVGYPK